MNFEEKKDYLDKAPDVISLNKAEDIVAPLFLRQIIKKSKAAANLKNYYCFHNDCRIGVYIEEQNFYLAFINNPKPLFGFKGFVTIQKVTEILKDEWNFFEEQSISGASIFQKHTDSEKSYLKYIMSFNEDPEVEKEILKKEEEEASRKKKEILKKDRAELKDFIKKEREDHIKKKYGDKALKLFGGDKEAKSENLRLMKKPILFNSIQELKASRAKMALKDAEFAAKEKKRKTDARLKFRDAELKKKAEAKLKKKADAELMKQEYARRQASRKADRKLIVERFGEKIAKAFESRRVAIGMPISYVIKIKGRGFETKRLITKDKESKKEKYGQYFKRLKGGNKSNHPSYEIEIEYEMDQNSGSWIVSSYKDL